MILVGHDFGGACISYAMEMFPSKVSKAVFLAAAMLTSGQSTLDIFSEKVGSLTDQGPVSNGLGMWGSNILFCKNDMLLQLKLLGEKIII